MGNKRYQPRLFLLVLAPALGYLQRCPNKSDL